MDCEQFELSRVVENQSHHVLEEMKIPDLLIRGYRNYDTGEVSARNMFNFSQFITCFESGADARTHIAMLRSILDDTVEINESSVIPDTKALVEMINNSFPKINSSLNEKYTSYVREKTITDLEYENIRLEQRRQETYFDRDVGREKYFTKDVLLNYIYRIGPFPIDSEETMLLLAACAQIAVQASSVDLAFKCLQAIYIHNNRRYDAKTQRQHMQHEAVLLKHGRFNDTTVRACKSFEKRYYDWEDSDNEHNKGDDSSATESGDDSAAEVENDSASKTGYEESDGSDEDAWILNHNVFRGINAPHSGSVEGVKRCQGVKCFKQISSDRVMLYGMFRYFLQLADAGSLILSKDPVRIVEDLHNARPLYTTSTADYVSALHINSLSPKAPLQAIVNEFHIHGACDAERKELCRREFHKCLAKKGEARFSEEWIESQFQEELREVSKCTSNQSYLSLEEFTARLDALTYSMTTRRIVRLFCKHGGDDTNRKELCRAAVFGHYKSQQAKRYNAEWIDQCFENRISKTVCPFNLFTPYTDSAEKGLEASLLKWAFTDRQAGLLPPLISGITADETYEQRFVRGLPMDKPVIALKSACGTGKSVACLAFLGHIPKDIPIIQISHRRALSCEICRLSSLQIGGRVTELYTDIIESEGNINLEMHRNVVCQYESLSRILPYTGPFVVIIDEVNSVLNQMMSTCGDAHGAHRKFVNLMRRAEKVVVMDGFLDDDRFNLINQYVSTKAYVIHNKYKTLNEHIVSFTNDKAKAIKQLGNLIEQGINIVVPCTLKADAETVYAYVRTLLQEEEVQIYTGDKRWPNGSDVNAVWIKAKVVIYTSTMDSGHSLDISHFTHAVCFFSNKVKLSYETALQMMSRSRPTKRFLIFVCSSASSENKPTSVAEILEEQYEKEVSVVKIQNNLHYGNLEMEDLEMEGKRIDCPYLHVLATNKMLVRKSCSNLFLPLIKELLLRDGVHPANMLELELDICDTDKNLVKVAEQQAKEDRPAPYITTLQREYFPTPYDVFNAMDDSTKKKYGDRRLIGAFQNQCALRQEGSNAENALANIKEKRDKALAMLSKCSVSGKFCENSVAQSRKLLMDGVLSLLDANETALELFHMFTGSRDPFSYGGILGSELRGNLRCAEVEEPKSIIDPAIRDKIASLYENWTENQDLVYKRQVSEQLTLATSLTLLNHLLKSQFDIQLKRTDKHTRQRGSKSDYVHVMIHSENFLTADAVNQTLPIIPQWNSELNPLDDTELLSVKHIDDKNVVIPGRAFDHWPTRVAAVQHQLGYVALQPQHMDWDRLKKKRKREYDEKKKRADWDALSHQDQQIQLLVQQAQEQMREDEWNSKSESIRLAAVQKQKEKSKSKRRQTQTHENKVKRIRTTANPYYEDLKVFSEFVDPFKPVNALRQPWTSGCNLCRPEFVGKPIFLIMKMLYDEEMAKYNIPSQLSQKYRQAELQSAIVGGK